MSEAPERIWIQSNHIPDSVALDKWDEEPDADEAHLFTGYIRADHVDALLKAEREKALREAASLSWLCFHNCDVEVDVVTADDILALISEDVTDG